MLQNNNNIISVELNWHKKAVNQFILCIQVKFFWVILTLWDNDSYDAIEGSKLQ